MKMTTPMMMMAAGLLAFGMTACEKDEAQPDEPAVVVTDTVKVPFFSSTYTLYSFSEGKIIPNSDSATNKWDFGIKRAALIVNSHASGPGQAGVIVKTGSYESLTVAPTNGYAYDTTSTKLAINSIPKHPGSWFLYDDVTHSFSPKAGLFFVFRTADGKYAKMEVLSVTYEDFTPPAPPQTLVYRFRYTLQADGGVNLK